jgi:uncharacterized protein YlzI (FlbEa/FlbD family)
MLQGTDDKEPREVVFHVGADHVVTVEPHPNGGSVVLVGSFQERYTVKESAQEVLGRVAIARACRTEAMASAVRAAVESIAEQGDGEEGGPRRG